MAATSVFAGVLIAKSGGFGLPMWVGVLGGVAAGALVELLNGVLVAYIKPPMIAMLAVNAGVLMNHTVVGRYSLSIGSNEAAAPRPSAP